MNFDLSPAIQRINNLGHDVIANLPNVVLAAVLLGFFVFLAKFARNLVARFTRAKLQTHNAGMAIGRLTQGFMLLVGLLISLSVALPTFKPTDVIQLLGIGSVAIGFAFRDIFQNFLAGILILITQPFRLQDQIVVSGYEGTVEDIQARATLIKTFDGRRVVIPNSDLFTQKVIVNTAFTLRRVEYSVGIGYGDDIAVAKRAIFKAIAQSDTALADPAPEVLVSDFAASSVQMRVRFWIDPSTQIHYLRALDEVLTKIKAELSGVGIEIPFQIQEIRFHDQTNETDGGRLPTREGSERFTAGGDGKS